MSNRVLNAWFAVGRSSELSRTEPLTVRLYGREFVLFRDEAGAVKATKPYCPHLGAHFGDGAVVDGQLQCGFHHWRFDGSGACKHIPNADRIPPKARLDLVPAAENGGMLFVWFHADGAAPTYEVPDIDARFGPQNRAAYFQLQANSTVQDMNENGLDLGRFPVIHGGKMGTGFRGSPRVEDLRMDGPEVSFEVHSEATTFSRPTKARVQMNFLGPSVFVARNVDPFPFDVIALHQPVEEDRIVGHFLVRVTLPSRVASRLLRGHVARRTKWEVERDARIWNRQRHNARPVLSTADGPIVSYRKWLKQFSAGASADTAVA